MMMSPKYVIKAKLAELLGCTPLTVSRLIKKGELKLKSSAKLNISLQRYIEHKKVDLESLKLESKYCKVILLELSVQITIILGVPKKVFLSDSIFDHSGIALYSFLS